MLLAICFVTITAMAQDQKPAANADQKPAPAQSADVKQDKSEWEKKFKSDLQLTDEQFARYNALNKEYSEKIEAVLKDATLTQDAQKEKKMSLKKEKESKLMEILNAEQQAKYKELQKQRKEAMEKEKEKKKEGNQQ